MANACAAAATLPGVRSLPHSLAIKAMSAEPQQNQPHWISLSLPELNRTQLAAGYLISMQQQ